MPDVNRVLIAEDDYLISTKLSTILNDLGYTVVGLAATGEEAVALTPALKPDVILMDLRMPEMDGLTAARLITERHPTPIVALTAFETPDLIAEASEAGMSYYLVKPATAQEIARAIRIATARFADMQELRRLNTALEKQIAERERTEAELHRLAWMLTKSVDPQPAQAAYNPPYSDLTALNTRRTILDAVGPETLRQIGRDAIDLLDTSVAIYESNGDYALGFFASGWCQLIDSTSYQHCNTKSPQKALASGCWLCHENCWHDSAKPAILSGTATDIACVGGIHLYAVPIIAGDDVIGAINIGYGTPPTDIPTLSALAEKFGIDPTTLQETAARYEPRPPYIIALAKKRLHTAAALIGKIVEHQQAEAEIQRYAADLQRSNRDLEQFGYVISHDLREPVRMVMGFMDLLKHHCQDQLDDQADIYIGYAVNGARRMRDMIDALLDLSRVETQGKAFTVIDTEAVLTRVLQVLGPAIDEAGARITHTALPAVMGDEAQMAQVFQNLIGNAIKFRRADAPIHIHVTAEAQDEVWLFSVNDNGIGLALCKRIIERHHGRIWVTSTPDEGSTLYIICILR